MGGETLRGVSISHEKVHFSAEVHRHGEINPWLLAHCRMSRGARGSQFGAKVRPLSAPPKQIRQVG